MELNARIERVGRGLFEGEEAVYHLIERVVGTLGLRVDESCPLGGCPTSGWLTVPHLEQTSGWRLMGPAPTALPFNPSLADGLQMVSTLPSSQRS
jgi:hypothetical protein